MPTDKKTDDAKVGSVFDLLGKSYNIVKENWQMFLLVNIFGVLYAVMKAFNPNDYDKTQQNNLMLGSDFSGLQLAGIAGGGLLILLTFLAINFFFFTMATSLETKTSGGKKPDFNELFNDGKKYFFPLLGLIIVSIVITIIGLILLIIPGIIAIARLAMAPYIMIDKKVGVEEALKQSNELGKKYFSKVWAAILLMILVSIFTAIISSIPILGPLVAVAITIAFSLLLALRYRELKGEQV